MKYTGEYKRLVFKKGTMWILLGLLTVVNSYNPCVVAAVS